MSSSSPVRPRPSPSPSPAVPAVAEGCVHDAVPFPADGLALLPTSSFPAPHHPPRPSPWLASRAPRARALPHPKTVSPSPCATPAAAWRGVTTADPSPAAPLRRRHLPGPSPSAPAYPAAVEHGILTATMPSRRARGGALPRPPPPGATPSAAVRGDRTAARRPASPSPPHPRAAPRVCRGDEANRSILVS